MQRQVPGWARTRRLTPWGRQARRDMADQRREYLTQRRDLTRQLRPLNQRVSELRQLQRAEWAPESIINRRFFERELRAVLPQQQRLLQQQRNLRSTYRSQRRRTATKRPMHATVTRHPWYGYGGWRPTRRRTWGDYRGINWRRRRQRA